MGFFFTPIFFFFHHFSLNQTYISSLRENCHLRKLEMGQLADEEVKEGLDFFLT